MIVGIHHRKGSFTERFAEYCAIKGYEVKIIDPYSNDFISEVKNVDVFLWHFSQEDYRTKLIAKKFSYLFQTLNIKTFPDFNTCWYFDDKIIQKYIFESLEIPHVKNFVYYSYPEALKYLKNIKLPIVFKLRGGAGSVNVKLIKSRFWLRYHLIRSFYFGYGLSSRLEQYKNRLWRLRRDKTLASCYGVFKGFLRLFIKSRKERSYGKEKGYFYFQDFIPNNTYDIRVIIANGKAISIKRGVRKGDFKASGSGLFEPMGEEDINIKCVDISFILSEKLKTQSLAVDFVFKNGEPLVVEISHGFVYYVYDSCPGHWNRQLEWVPGHLNLQNEILDNLFNEQ